MRELKPWQEARGVFRGLRREDGKQILTLECVDDIVVEGLRIDVEPGTTIGVLRTDEGYIVRTGGR